MKFLASILLASALLLGCTPANAMECDRPPLVYDAATNGATVLRAGNASTVFICGYQIVWGGTATVKLVTGTGTTCGTNETAITPAFSGVAQTVVPDSSSLTRGLRAGPDLDLCIKTSAGVAVQAIIFYTLR